MAEVDKDKKKEKKSKKQASFEERLDRLESVLAETQADLLKANKRIGSLEQERDSLNRHLRVVEDNVKRLEGQILQQITPLRSQVTLLMETRSALQSSVKVAPPWSGPLSTSTTASSSASVASSSKSSIGGFFGTVSSWISRPKFKVSVRQGNATTDQLQCVKRMLQIRDSNLEFLDERAEVDAIVWLIFAPGGRGDDGKVLKELEETKQSSINASAITVGLVLATGETPVLPKLGSFEHTFCFNLADDFQTLRSSHTPTETAVTKFMAVLTK